MDSTSLSTGTLRSDRVGIPKEMKTSDNREGRSTM